MERSDRHAGAFACSFASSGEHLRIWSGFSVLHMETCNCTSAWVGGRYGPELGKFVRGALPSDGGRWESDVGEEQEDPEDQRPKA